ncbi:unnamed protein product [Caenorhabditis sp. 36 PRJEB53466]|nr:unnamed protein product [Caenorhabditis sp. 36 PRJEB53466]
MEPLSDAQKFIQDLTYAVESRSTELIDRLISRDFVFAKCLEEISREQLISALLNASAGQLAIRLNNVNVQAEVNIKMNVTVTGLGNLGQTWLYITKYGKRYMLIHGQEMRCP